MGTFRGGMKGLLEMARRAAQRRGQSLTTAHALLVMLQDDRECSAILRGRGVVEGDLTAILSTYEEPEASLELAAERAQKIADLLGEEPRSIHLLLALAKDSRSA
ncbi:MAG: hypothetical protein KC416_15155, partial [Myxococcales bacterium]|nr:hypothetical protein [Myxococcales bacterium]